MILSEGDIMDKRKTWITKEEEKMIISTYALHSGEIVPHGDPTEHQYEILSACHSRTGLRGLIAIRPEFSIDKPIEDKPRILVSHSDSTGKIVFRDVWERDFEGKLYWRFRNPINIPISDRDRIVELENENSMLKGRLLILEKKYQHIIDTVAVTKPAGRKPNPEKLDAQAAKVKELLDQGLGEKEITEQLQIGRATFYRMKKRLRDI